MTLLRPYNNTIVHIADIHIRNIKRHDEYRYIFSLFYSKLEQLERDNQQKPIVVIAGDIVHSKTEISPELVALVGEFLTEISKRSDGTIVIPGNHDANLNNSHRLDALTPIIEPLMKFIPNLFYWKTNGIYQSHEGIEFGVLSLLDDPKTYPTGKMCNADNKKIALYHGALNASLLDSGMRIQTDHKLSIFTGFDVALLGDIHKMQYLDPEQRIAYPSSLIQQNFGEDFKKHGYMIWNLDDFSSAFHALDNPYGYFTIEIDKDIIKNELPVLTNKNRIRVKATNSITTNIKQLISDICRKYRLNANDITINAIGSDQPTVSIHDKLIDGDVRNINVQQNLLKIHLNNQGVSADVIAKVQDIHVNIMKEIPSVDNMKNGIWKPISFKFSNMFSYGEDNFIDFMTLEGLYGIFGPNATGKSSVIDAWCFCMFDECARTYKADKIMNVDKNSFSCEFIFEQNGNRYIIRKHAIKQKGYWAGKVKVNVDFYREDIESGELICLNGERRQETVSIIEEYLGSFKDFTLTTLSTQLNGNANFIQKTQSERKDALAQYLDLSIFEVPYDIANKQASAIQTQINTHVAKDYDVILCNISQSINDYKYQQCIVQAELDNMLLSKQELFDQIQIKSSLIPTNIDLNIDINEINNNVIHLNDSIVSAREVIDKLNAKKKTKQISLNSAESNLISKEKYKRYTAIRTECDLKREGINKLKIQLATVEATIQTAEKKAEQLKDLSYDPNCKFCMGNVFVQDAIHTKDTLQSLYDQRTELFNTITSDEMFVNLNVPILETLVFCEKNKIIVDSLLNEQKTIDSEIKSVQSNIKLIQNQISTAKLRIKEYNKSKKSYAQKELLMTEIEHLKREYSIVLNREQEKNNELTRLISNINNNLHKEQELLLNQKEMYELQGKLELYNLYLNAIARNGIPYDLIKRAIPLLQCHVNSILEQIVDFGVLLFIDDKDINAYIVYEDKHWPLEMTSGMERFITSIALRVALLQITTLPRPNMLMIDEGFGVLDSNNTNSLHMLFSYLKEVFNVVLIISHIEAIKDIVDNNLVVEQKNGYSFITNE